MLAISDQMSVCVEVCCDSICSVRNSTIANVCRVEICSDLTSGGVTPSSGFIQQAVKISNSLCNNENQQLKQCGCLVTKVMVLIRPRAGNFLFGEDDLEIMKTDILETAKNGAYGVVIGSLKRLNSEDYDIDFDQVSTMANLAHSLGLKVTLHRAFDCLSFNLMKNAIRLSSSIGITRILTSGGGKSALEGISNLKELNTIAGQQKNRIIILAGAGINLNNYEEIIHKTMVTEIHGSFRKTVHHENDDKNNINENNNQSKIDKFNNNIKDINNQSKIDADSAKVVCETIQKIACYDTISALVSGCGKV